MLCEKQPRPAAVATTCVLRRALQNVHVSGAASTTESRWAVLLAGCCPSPTPGCPQSSLPEKRVDGAVPDPFRRKEIEITYRLPCTANICADMCNVRGCFQGVCKYPPDQVGVPRICICRGHVATCA
nr:uncharacterized protein LOC129387524 isoform X1 [Dermacentor andersoni]